MVKILRIARFLRGECTRTLHDPSKNKQAQSRLAIIMIFLVGVGGVFACASACAYAPADKSRTAANRRWLTKCTDFAAAPGMRLAKSCIYANHLQLRCDVVLQTARTKKSNALRAFHFLVGVGRQLSDYPTCP